MKLKMLVYITLLLVLSVGVVQAAEETKCLKKIGVHPVHEPLTSEEELCEMMQDEKIWYDIAEALSDAECLGIQCSELSTKINEFFTNNCRNLQQCKIQKENYKKEDSVTFHWMMFRPNGKGKIKVAKNLKWCGAEDLPAYEFDIVYDKKKYTFTVPKGCGNLALLKVEEYPECPKCTQCPENCTEKCRDNPESDDCKKCNDQGCLQKFNQCKEKDCNQCSDECAENPYAKGCPQQCRECKDEGCLRIVPVIVKEPFNLCKEKDCNQCSDKCAENPYAKECPQQCRECKDEECFVPVEVPVEVEKIVPVNPCRNCNDCSYECKTGGECENTVCRKCQSNDCFVPVTKTITCIQPCPPAFHFIADLGYYRQSDPADYLFGRVGIEYNLSENASWLEGVSLLTMIGTAPKIGGSDGDTAFLLDVIAQYNWLQSYDSWSLPLLRGFTGIGLGGWFTSGDVLDDSGDSDLDIIANIGVRLPNHPDISVFFEMRNAVDELDSISEYGRFGAGVRIQF
ncbi:Outer membrane protein beta-barrel domain-containing protein [Candidatus Electrothrix aarhusensis]